MREGVALLNPLASLNCHGMRILSWVPRSWTRLPSSTVLRSMTPVVSVGRMSPVFTRVAFNPSRAWKSPMSGLRVSQEKRP